MKKLSLKSLQTQLDALKVFKASTINPKVKKVEQVETQTIATNTTMKGSFFFMYALSWIFLMINKIPIINKVSKLMTLYYGRTSI